MVKDVGGFGHLHHEGGLAGGQIIHGTHPGEDPIGDADRGGSGRYPAADLRHQLDQADLAQIAALATGVGAREHHQIGALTELHIIGGEARFPPAAAPPQDGGWPPAAALGRR